VTATSGRGVGLDVVREAIDRLGGEVFVRTEPGKGTAFELIVPPSIAATDALKVASSGNVVAIPLDAVKRSLRVAGAEISLGPRGASLLYADKAIPFVPLSAVLDRTRQPIDRPWTVVIVSGTDGLAAIGVDRLFGVSRIVVHPLPELAPANAIVAGAALDAEGNPQLVLDPDGLVAEVRRGDVTEYDTAPARNSVLVIDDSLTTRMLEQSILESAGFDVDVALSAEEGLEKAHRKRYALFLVDVEMPGMDGFTFIERVRSHPSLHDIPAILVTSRAAPEDLRRGREVGAQGHIVKSDFNQTELLALIRPLLK
jgi:two-component system chemotaxis sensor kinase CheA